MKNKFAAQLYTLRNEISEDFPGVLKSLKEIGWEAVQIDGLFGYTREEIADTLNSLELRTAGIHVGLDRLNNDLENVVAEANLFQTTEIICPYLDDNMRNTDGYIKARKELREVARKIAPLGLKLGYHNHDFEFRTKIEGEFALDYILEHSDDVHLFPEIDTYWVKKAGLDPLTYMQKYSLKMPILHLKDMTSDGTEDFAEIGNGCIQFQPILQWGERNGVEWYVVEQDYCTGHPLDSLAISLENLQKMTTNMTN
jgi:sugar phosphate isomerase/epimerase